MPVWRELAYLTSTDSPALHFYLGRAAHLATGEDTGPAMPDNRSDRVYGAGGIPSSNGPQGSTISRNLSEIGGLLDKIPR